MAMNPLPPQAYTKDTLLLAYSWLMNQAPAIREMATTPDILVSLYLKATRDGDAALDRPSIQNFKTELRNLAGIMGHLDDSDGAAVAAFSQSHSIAQSLSQTQTQNTIHVNISPNGPGFNVNTVSQSPVDQRNESRNERRVQERQQLLASSTHGHSPSPSLDWGSLFDEKTMKMIHHIQEELNLSSETESIRLLIKLGYLKAQQFITE
ncbi:MAG TPA: hypothetical protein PLU50_11250 [Pseudobdellovibrionaceae bacterium]|nr:hypothetical protein [Pseudobdellovibrionaceae bacterium]